MIADRTDRLLFPVWIAFTPLAAFTAVFGPLLFLFPGSTADYWSWEIKPEMSAVWVGAGYTFGASTITLMLVTGRWRSAIVPVLATWPFSVVMLLATLLHQDRMFLGTANYYVWLAIYAALPFALPAVWWLNKGQDPGPQRDDVIVPRSLSLGARVLAMPAVLVSLIMIASPSTAAGFWPWQLAPLMSMVIGGWVLFLSAGLFCLFFERRYMAYRVFLPSAAAWMTILFVASFFHLDDFDFGRARSWLWFVLVAVLAIAVLAVYVGMERYSRRHAIQVRFAVTHFVPSA